MKTSHPYNRLKNVLDALDRSDKFEKGYLVACNTTGREGLERNHRFRCFKLKNKAKENQMKNSKEVK